MSDNEYWSTLKSHIRNRPDATCFVIDGKAVSWHELDRRTDALASALLHSVPELPRRVALHVRESEAYLYALFALIRLGAVAIPLPDRLNAVTLAGILKDCRPDAIVCAAQDLSKMSAAAGTAEVLDVSGLLRDARAKQGLGGFSFDVGPDTPMLIVYSSGTTSIPKGVVHTHRTRHAAAVKAIRHYHIDERERTLISAPTYTSRALAQTLTTAHAGGTTIFLESFDVGRFIDLTARYAPTTVDLVPTQFLKLLAHDRFRPEVFACCRFVLCTGAAPNAGLTRRLFELFPHNFIQAYGSTETDFVSRMPRNAPPEKHGSVGPPCSVSLRVLDTHDVPVATGEIGEIAVCSPSNMLEYLDRPAETAAAFWTDPATHERYFKTGDLGRIDADGYLWLTGRRKEMIITAGFNVYPVDIENVLTDHAHVAEAAVVGVSHPILGETPVAFVELSSGADRAADSASKIHAWANARLNTNQRLFGVHVLRELPRNASGKVLKHRLAELARSPAHGSAEPMRRRRPLESGV